MAAGPRMLVLWGYENHALPVYGCGRLWADSRYGNVMWENDATNTATPWHGSFHIVREGIIVWFDAFYGWRHAQPHLKWAALRGTAQGDFLGTDYAGRFIQLRPITRWLHDEATDEWVAMQEFMGQYSTAITISRWGRRGM